MYDSHEDAALFRGLSSLWAAWHSFEGGVEFRTVGLCLGFRV